MAETTQLMPPPPESTYHSFEDAEDACQKWAKEHHYALSKVGTRREYKFGPYKIAYFQCDRGKVYESTAQIRRTSSKQTGCPFKLRVSRIAPVTVIVEEMPEIHNYRLTTINTTHNHEPSWHPLAHAIHRRRSEYIRETIGAETQAGVKAKQIITRLNQENPTINLKRKDVYNEILRARQLQLRGNTPIEALLEQLQDPERWISAHQVDSNGRLTHLFIVYTKIVPIFESHPDVLMADCTYRTNRFKMPLLHFVGSNSIGSHYTIAFCFMPRETHPDYLWALRCIQRLLYESLDNAQARTPKVFLSDNEEALRSACAEVWPAVPQLLCLWHINKNVQDHLQKHFRQANGLFEPTEAQREEQSQKREAFMGDWAKLNRAKTEAQYEELWALFQQEYREYPRLVRYIREHQYPQRMQVAKPWTSQYRHYGHISTSKLESAHNQMKRCLSNSQGHLLDVIQRLVNYWDDCYHEYKAKLAHQYTSIRAEINAQNINEWDDNLNEFITPYALQLCRQQLDKARKNEMNPDCSGKFTLIWGIPCCHKQRLWSRLGRKVQASEFDTHWLWERRGANGVFQEAVRKPIPTIFDPAIVFGKGRPRRDNSTRRDLSQFELSDLDRRSIGGTPSSTPSSTPSRTPSRTPALSERSRSVTGTPSIIVSHETPPPIGPIDPMLLGAWSPAPMTESQPSSAGSTPAPSVDLDAGTPAPTARLTYQFLRSSPATGASFSRPKRTLSQTSRSMEPPPKRSRGTPRQKVAPALKADAINRMVLAMSEIGQPPNTQQLQAMNSHWLNLMDTERIVASIVTQMVIAGHPASAEQIQAIRKGVPRPSSPI